MRAMMQDVDNDDNNEMLVKMTDGSDNDEH